MEWLLSNWKWILYFCLMIIIIPAFIYQEINLDKDLSDPKRSHKIQQDFEKEFKEIKLPSQTAVNHFENMSKPRSSILLTTRYRTELSKENFVDILQNELNKKGWIYYDKSENNTEFYFCRGKFDAVLNYQGGNGIFGDDGNYYSLEFILGLGVRNRSYNLPKNCTQ